MFPGRGRQDSSTWTGGFEDTGESCPKRSDSKEGGDVGPGREEGTFLDWIGEF